MTQYVALLRGINVGGKHVVPMQELRDMLAALGCESVQTYIQSGNAVFVSDDTASDISGSLQAAILQRFGFEPQVLVLTAARFREIAQANPYADKDADPRSLHVWFLTDAPGTPQLDALEAVKASNEQFELREDAFYLYAPDGIGRSRLASKTDRCLGVATTARNWRTVTKLLQLLA